ncbi:hypothetical protein GOP47_0018313 [Adiantum capillus-veneris]|uniref:Uncharacterized protein n=1 Tax=Adiantum capillus-veneris TaxID=13818 RepID=A0A9D4UH99_ADICA|nr:hypothetical protein GOP47_0018313 [Adiantum capillus-veneris]
MHYYKLDAQHKVKVVDPTIFQILKIKFDTRNSLANINLETYELLLCESDSTCFILNSLEGHHGMSRLAIPRLIEAIENCPPITKLMDDMQFLIVKPPLQEDSFLCGWRVITNAKLMVEYTYCNPKRILG